MIFQKTKNHELKKKLSQMRSKLEKEDLDSDSISINIIEQEKRLRFIKNDLKSKQLNTIIQDEFLKRVNNISNNFEKATNNLDFLHKQNLDGRKFKILIFCFKFKLSNSHSNLKSKR
jgi:hypothetical protein